MDNLNPISVPPPIPTIPAAPVLSAADHPDDKSPVSGFVGAVEAILRQPRRIHYQFSQGGSGSLIFMLLLISVFCAAIYGLVVGSFSMGDQLWAAPVKIVLGLFASAFICLPSLYIFSCLSGAQAKLATMLGLLAGLLALMTILLLGFAPVAWVFSQSTKSLPMMGTLHLIFWFVGTIFALRFLNQGLRFLQVRSDGALTVWTIIFLLVMLQMSTALRPIIGSSSTFLPTEKKFFIAHWIDTIRSAAEEKPVTTSQQTTPAQQTTPVLPTFRNQ
ncbi:MAG TPA: hypothetical protein VGE41_06350 [Verrucomicrobiae bacterium]|jgi:hypothetical protein